ncbi:sugar transferase [Vagococcus fluvialis]|uniref:sugar transferase n=1 Tax=Vagococcus fluvialis TaxID=2738 RepID=UPI0022E54EC7|nr:sugar transferase [Vagococcus fluvialis]
MNKLIKRLLDLIISFIMLLILLPILIIIGILIRIDSKGPIFFLQERIGLNGKTFNIIKFRTMIVNAESIGDGLSIKSETDSRITRLGSFLRKTSLDELPQFINVFLGSMSIVGPRPPVTYYPYNGIDNYPNKAKRRFQMRPGITGLAQVRVRNSATWDERIEIDIEYIEGYNLLLDIQIFFLTIKKIFEKENIY